MSDEGVQIDRPKDINYHTVIEDLLKAEERRDFNAIYSFYEPNMRRYWDMNNPSYQSLKKRYEYIWGFTSNSLNKIEKIEKISDDNYNLYTEFSYYNIKKEESFVTKSIIRYVFDDLGKVKETYGLKQDIQEVISSEDINYVDKSQSQISKNEVNLESQPPNSLYYKFRTSFYNPLFKIALRDKPSVSGLEIYLCPKDAMVYVIDNSGDNYFKVYVNGYIGYVTKNYLKRKY